MMPKQNQKEFLDIAQSLKPTLNQEIVYCKDVIKVINDKNEIHGWKVEKIGSYNLLKDKAYGKGDNFTVDFGNHQVGYLTLKIIPVGSPPDAPLRMKLTFGEMCCEVKEPFSNYEGIISSSWLQEEIITVDILPSEIKLPRRYSFRYLKIEIIDTSTKYQVAFDNIYCTTATSADISKIKPLSLEIDDELKQIDKVSIKTLQDCMQDVFEDGPKRDRRLWLGDLRLQAIANYSSFKNYDLVKRCLYLFAGVQNEKGQIPACLFLEPTVIGDDTFFWDYSMFFMDCLYNYYEETKDTLIVKDLWETAYRQIEIVLEKLDDNNILKSDTNFSSFIDWNMELDREAASQAVLIYCMKRALALAEQFSFSESKLLNEKIIELSNASLKYLWDEEQGLFVSGETKQISWASQIWMVIAGVLPIEKNKQLMDTLFEKQPNIKLVTPYAYHHLIEALILSDKKDFAIKQMKAYWGEMIKDGADTFWELYKPDDKKFSPYGNNLINSYCHAWSCTPTYFIRKYLI
ncbi:sugar hydrolase [Clostridium estertheticum]|nr:sugar hydrolase [Clostridium estertheticum]MCB2348936.1 sugar hydrolase [Clostridium estertheticum]